MAQTLPYLPSYKNVGTLFERVATAKKPDAFTQAYLRDTIGLKGTADRALIPLLRTLGFLDGGGRPTPAYDLLKNKSTARAAIAEGIRNAYKPLFDANENADTLPADELKGLISQVAGTDEDMTSRIALTFTALAKQADFKAGVPKPGKEPSKEHDKEHVQQATRRSPGEGLRPEFHYDIEIHLPANGTEETYLNIFNALRKTFE